MIESPSESEYEGRVKVVVLVTTAVTEVVEVTANTGALLAKTTVN